MRLASLRLNGTTTAARTGGDTVQSATTDDLVFNPAALVECISSILTLNPGDVIATGTTGGVGHARTPPRYIEDGSKVVTRVGGIGEPANTARREKRNG
ncbi:2-keto-4-pentenoate hydratase/2-oxohepta-3-ene-1,7-dioic acid hydratase in catechol pathway [Lipingzhangella halophila]|uniref:2-keto-4-pentenoate hydratase/2-oxohepta-3-ene-1,7-dioic acid hydratase in catechol pathway n=1 Tax=Lipingzhangella halophila TaxID=1783352 RepID=A0A7W7W6U6_9ACTN|nr:fumarylacetoacetate hydrolase family protein [Lipingzhangella halophila]MBB4935190.1 2-keto-4-pentenoate hydratase/2-oxohepta-3-ene-1,7-dioic acid hydratase in catechol pathway [Lipingzhangella halophila]